MVPPGRDAVGKTAVIEAWNRNTNAAVAKAVSNTGKATLWGFVRGHMAPCAAEYSEKHESCSGLPFDHEAINHGASGYIGG